MVERQDAKVEEVALPRQEECLGHTPSTCHTYTALAFSLYTGRDIDSDDSHASSLSGSSGNESCAQDTEQIHGKHSVVSVKVLVFSF